MFHWNSEFGTSDQVGSKMKNILQIPTAILEFTQTLTIRFPEVEISIDSPKDYQGLWWIDICLNKLSFEVLWKSGFDFGIFTSKPTYMDRPDEQYRSVISAGHRVEELILETSKESNE